MSELEVVLADCVDLWMRGQDPATVLQRHPGVASEVSQLLLIAQAVRESGELKESSIGHYTRRLQEYSF